jgi:hypothetical protein
MVDDYTRLHRPADSVSFGGPFPSGDDVRGRDPPKQIELTVVVDSTAIQDALDSS